MTSTHGRPMQASRSWAANAAAHRPAAAVWRASLSSSNALATRRSSYRPNQAASATQATTAATGGGGVAVALVEQAGGGHRGHDHQDVDGQAGGQCDPGGRAAAGAA